MSTRACTDALPDHTHVAVFRANKAANADSRVLDVQPDSASLGTAVHIAYPQANARPGPTTHARPAGADNNVANIQSN